jgi:hypothetical protein
MVHADPSLQEGGLDVNCNGAGSPSACILLDLQSAAFRMRDAAKVAHLEKATDVLEAVSKNPFSNHSQTKQSHILAWRKFYAARLEARRAPHAVSLSQRPVAVARHRRKLHTRPRAQYTAKNLMRPSSSRA